MKIAEDSLGHAFEKAGEVGVGFVHDFAPELLEPLQQLADVNPSCLWQEIQSRDFTEELLTLKGVIKTYANQLNPLSNMDFVHIIHRANGATHWHRDVSDQDRAAAGYRKGRFRAGFNLYGNVKLGFEDPNGKTQWEPISPGSLYVMDYTHNPWHGAVPLDDASASIITSKVLLLTDVAQ